MQRDISFRDLNSPKYKGLTIAGGFLILLAALCWWFEWTSYLSYVFAGLAVMSFTILSMDSFTTSNAVSYGSKSMTVKLLGEKTTGFLFRKVSKVSMMEQGLLIRVEGMEDLKLSRKRYNDTSLEKLQTIIKEKTTLQ